MLQPFRGDPRKMMERYYDAHLYVSNWAFGYDEEDELEPPVPAGQVKRGAGVWRFVGMG